MWAPSPRHKPLGPGETISRKAAGCLGVCLPARSRPSRETKGLTVLGYVLQVPRRIPDAFRSIPQPPGADTVPPLRMTTGASPGLSPGDDDAQSRGAPKRPGPCQASLSPRHLLHSHQLAGTTGVPVLQKRKWRQKGRDEISIQAVHLALRTGRLASTLRPTLRTRCASQRVRGARCPDPRVPPTPRGRENAAPLSPPVRPGPGRPSFPRLSTWE